MRRTLVAVAALWAVAGGAMAMPKPEVPPAVKVESLPPHAKVRPVKLSRAVVAMKDGEVWQHFNNAPCSMGPYEYTWKSGQIELDVGRFAPPFDEELAKLGFNGGASQSLFDNNETRDTLEVGARILTIRSYMCDKYLSATTTTYVATEWQVYDPHRREIVGKVETVGGNERPSIRDGEATAGIIDAFRENVRALLADATFRQLVVSSSQAAPEPIRATTPISLVISGAPPVRPISEVTGSVVAIFAGSAMGSGFLVSDDGYLITNQHVVGSASSVRVRWSDGFEAPGEVVRVDKRRDVALIKTSPRSGRQALALKRGTPAVGDAVFAIGTPLDPTLQNTVTKGIVSANRILDGFAYIQSDVGIDHGNSGGPLVDDKGRVVAISVARIAPGDGQRGLNLFIPIGDALDFLALKTGP